MSSASPASLRKQRPVFHRSIAAVRGVIRWAFALASEIFPLKFREEKAAPGIQEPLLRVQLSPVLQCRDYLHTRPIAWRWPASSVHSQCRADRQQSSRDLCPCLIERLAYHFETGGVPV